MRRRFLAVALVIAAVAGFAAAIAEAVASQRVSLAARPTAIRWGQPATLFGAVDSRRADEIVTIQAKDCGLTSYTEVAEVTTEAGGSFTTQFGRAITTSVRAVWKGEASAPVTIRQAPHVVLDRQARSRFSVGVNARTQFWRKRILIQRRRGGAWRTIRSIVLTEQEAAGQGFVWSSTEFRLSVPRRTSLRAVFPLSQARPCYLAGVSNTFRT
jgi:hypothetical protein